MVRFCPELGANWIMKHGGPDNETYDVCPCVDKNILYVGGIIPVKCLIRVALTKGSCFRKYQIQES